LVNVVSTTGNNFSDDAVGGDAGAAPEGPLTTPAIRHTATNRVMLCIFAELLGLARFVTPQQFEQRGVKSQGRNLTLRRICSEFNVVWCQLVSIGGFAFGKFMSKFAQNGHWGQPL
jgi:hypothetical protein